MAAPTLVDQTNQLGDSLRGALLGKIACQVKHPSKTEVADTAAELQRAAGMTFLNREAGTSQTQDWTQKIANDPVAASYIVPGDVSEKYLAAVDAIQANLANAAEAAKDPAKFDRQLAAGLSAAETMYNLLGNMTAQAERCRSENDNPLMTRTCLYVERTAGTKAAGLATLLSAARAARAALDCRAGGPADSRVWYQACRVVRLSVKAEQEEASDNPYVDAPSTPDVGEYACKVTRDIAEGIVSPLADTTRVLTHLSEWSPVERAVLARIAQRQARFISKKGDNTMAQKVMTNLLTLAMDKISRADEKTGCQGIKHVDLGF